MEDMNRLVAENLKKVREERKLSLDKLAELTGVSKSMLRQIEVGDSNPTIATLWKIANGLKLSFTELLSAAPQQTRVLRKAGLVPLTGDNGKYRLYPYFLIEEGRKFEIYAIEIDPGGFLSADPHPVGTQEFLTVFEGELTIRVNDQEFVVNQGDAFQFKANHPHAYRNSGKNLVRVSLVIDYR